METNSSQQPEIGKDPDNADLREALKRNLTAEFQEALKSASELTDSQRNALCLLVTAGRVTVPAILGVFKEKEDK